MHTFYKHQTSNIKHQYNCCHNIDHSSTCPILSISPSTSLRQIRCPDTELYGREKTRSSKRVSNPGCYASNTQLLLAPLMPYLDKTQMPTIFGVSGYSGAGTKSGEKDAEGRPKTVAKIVSLYFRHDLQQKGADGRDQRIWERVSDHMPLPTISTNENLPSTSLLSLLPLIHSSYPSSPTSHLGSLVSSLSSTLP
jgi:hypothetical protein